MCLVGVVVRKYIDFLILLIPSSLLSALFCSSIPTFCSFLNIIIYIHNVNIIVSMAHIWYVFSCIASHEATTHPFSFIACAKSIFLPQSIFCPLKL